MPHLKLRANGDSLFDLISSSTTSILRSQLESCGIWYMYDNLIFDDQSTTFSARESGMRRKKGEELNTCTQQNTLRGRGCAYAGKGESCASCRESKT